MRALRSAFPMDERSATSFFVVSKPSRALASAESRFIQLACERFTRIRVILVQTGAFGPRRGGDADPRNVSLGGRGRGGGFDSTRQRNPNSNLFFSFWSMALATFVKISVNASSLKMPPPIVLPSTGFQLHVQKLSIFAP